MTDCMLMNRQRCDTYLLAYVCLCTFAKLTKQEIMGEIKSYSNNISVENLNRCNKDNFHSWGWFVNRLGWSIVGSYRCTRMIFCSEVVSILDVGEDASLWGMMGYRPFFIENSITPSYTKVRYPRLLLLLLGIYSAQLWFMDIGATSS